MNNEIRHVSCRVDVLRNGAATQWTLDAVTPPTINMSMEGDIKLSLSGTFVKNDAVDYLNDEIKPCLIVDGVEYPLGVYMIGTRTTQHTEYGTDQDDIEAYDRSLKLQQTKTESRLYFAAGTKYIEAIQGLLGGAGIAIISAEPCEAVLATDREDWEIGTDYLTIINALLAEINYSPIWFDFDGVARLELYVAPTAANIDHAYTADRYSIIREEYSSELDIYDAPNVFVVTVSNPDYDTPMTATGVNDSPLSALSTIARGRRIMATPIQLDNIASQEALQAYANNLAAKSMLATERTVFYTALNPVHGVGDVISLDNGKLQGIYEETDWSMTLEAGALMQHGAKRVLII